MLFLLWLASNLAYLWSIPIGICFAFLAQTNYALLHEAIHGILYPKAHINRLLGRISAAMFPTSYTLMRHTHIVHHCCNRSDHEMFDYYYSQDKIFYKHIQWYGIVTGIYWPLIPIGCTLLALSPSLLRNHFWQKFRSTNVLFEDLTDKDFMIMRYEILIAMVSFVSLFMLLDLHWQQCLSLYLMAGFLWSTRQYVTHAFTKRDIIHGALNLQTSWLMDKFILHGGWDLVHHQNPHLSWIHLPDMANQSADRVAFWSQYMRLWCGPLPCKEQAPKVLARKNYTLLGKK
ncbi:MAG: fatty acid desaturase [Mariprofundaceae bacterium]|nr:fatty acid desaturase [Mariprofundaceae bacterium]